MVDYREFVASNRDQRGAKIGAIIAAAALLAVPFILALHMLGAI